MPTTVPILVDFWLSADHPDTSIAVLWSALCRSHGMPESVNAFDARPPGVPDAPPAMRYELDAGGGGIRRYRYETSLL